MADQVSGFPHDPPSAGRSRLGQFLRGVRVLDLSAFLPGPLASLLLADMGAEVLKVEPPGGDALRALGPRDAGGKPAFHAAVNAGKTVRRMDLKDPAERDELLRLVPEFDVLIEGFRPGVMARLGLGYEALRALNLGLIYCSLSGYSAAGPRAAHAGHNANYLAEAETWEGEGEDFAQHGQLHRDRATHHSDRSCSSFSGVSRPWPTSPTRRTRPPWSGG